MPISTLFFDLDDTLYPPTTGIWSLIRQRMDLYMAEKLSIDPLVIPGLRRHLFETYGTTMRGLQVTYHIDETEYLAYVHDVQVEQRLQPDLKLRAMLLSLPYRRLIFTNSDQNHAGRVLRCLGIEDCFEQVIDIRLVAPSCKPQPEAYLLALNCAGENDPRSCLLADDSPRNLATARALGFITVQIGGEPASPPFDAHVQSVLDLPQALTRFGL
ncbi:MAG TPA: pyrimidine 5'-nucleotidase [Anaerolineaceae bacterium]|nr:pyrimidine 5'-nucleotidase [Anaerolineaceae bacterium]